MLLKIKSLLFLVTVFLLSPYLKGSDQEIQTVKEEKLFKVYQLYSSEPTPDELWDKVLSGLAEKSYQVQKGDTLWGISQMLFGDPYFWPKLWSLNHDIIFNPHFIYPDNKLLFDLGSEQRPPSVTILTDEADGSVTAPSLTQGEGEPAPGAEAAAAAPEAAPEEAVNSQAAGEQEATPLQAQSESAHEAQAEAPVDAAPVEEAPPEVVKPKTVLQNYMAKNYPPLLSVELPTEGLPQMPEPKIISQKGVLPQSLPPWVAKDTDREPPVIDFKSIQRAPTEQTWLMPCWVSDTEKPVLAEVSSMEGGDITAHENQWIFVSAEPQNIEIGQKYLIVKKYEQIKPGVWIYSIEGEAQMGAVVSPSNQSSADSKKATYRAMVTRAWSVITQDSELISSEEYTFNQQSDLENLNPVAGASIVGGSCHNKRRIFGEGEFIFIKTQQQGQMNVGDKVPIYRDELGRNDKTTAHNHTRLVGAAQVVKTSGGWATAFVLKSEEPIEVGDRTSAQSNLE